MDPLYPESALCCGRSSWQLSSSQQERKWLSGAVLNSPSTGRKSSLNEAVSRIGHAVRAHQSSHPLIRLQYFQHPFAGKKQSLGCRSAITIKKKKRAYGDVIVQVYSGRRRVCVGVIFLHTLTDCLQQTDELEATIISC